MMRILYRAAAAAVLFLLASLAALAQVPVGYVQVTGALTTDSSGVKVVSGTIGFAPVNNIGQPIGYQVNGAGHAITSPVTTLVTNGAFSIQLADTTLTVPVNVCFSVTVTDNTSGKSYLGPGYTCFQPAGYGSAVSGGMCTAASGTAGGTCNFDKFQPNLPGLVVQQTGPAGPAGPAGAAGPPGGSLSYPGCTADGSNGMTCTGKIAANPLSAPIVTVTGTPTNPTDAATVGYVATHSATYNSSSTINTSNSQIQADSVVATMSYGLTMFGDSNSIAACPLSPTTLCYQAILSADYGLTPVNNAVSGDDVGDETWHILTSLNPTDSGNPIVTSMIGTNNYTRLSGTYLQMWLAGHAWGAMSTTNKILAGAAAVTWTGTTAADTTWANANGITCTAGPCTGTVTISAGTPNVFYLWYKMTATGTNITVTVDGTSVSDTVTSSSTVSTAWSAAPIHQPTTAGLARYPAANTGTAASHTVVVTLQTNGTVLAFGFPPIKRYRGLSHPRVIAAGVIPQQNAANASAVALLNGYNLSGSKLLVGDGLDVPFVDSNSIDPVLDMASTDTQGCIHTLTPGLHMSGCGTRHLAQLFESAIGAVPPPQLTSPINVSGISAPTNLVNANGGDPVKYLSTGTTFPKGSWCADTFGSFCWGITSLAVGSGFDTIITSNNSNARVCFSFTAINPTPTQVATGELSCIANNGTAFIHNMILAAGGWIQMGATADPANITAGYNLRGFSTNSAGISNVINIGPSITTNAGLDFQNATTIGYGPGMYTAQAQAIHMAWYSESPGLVTGPTHFTFPIWFTSDGTTHSTYSQHTQTVTASLPACNAAAKGMEAQVTDATTPTYLGTLTGGGAVFTPVVCNGTAWVSY